ncbi:MAG TPA: DegT/DnrJ/EryC1/StrS family aminotransferase [Anaerolineae bacterium]|nr:DegT/DnrJ/EryC1/StrS family aminotransferase [Anaerolineae bacterium]
MAAKPKKSPTISMSSPDITNKEREAVAAVLRTPNLSMGKQIIAFEEAIRNFVNSKHAIGVSSGTAGLHLCLIAAGIEDGDYVITTPFSFISSTNVILFERAIPIFVDIDPKTGNIDPQLLKEAITDLTTNEHAAKKWFPRTGASSYKPPKAILPVDVFGQPADMSPINNISRTHNLVVVEDSCEALGARYQGQSAGTLGDMGVFAFYPNKQITTGEGGIVVTNNDKYAKLIRSLRNQGRSPGDTWLSHTNLGYNYRLDEMSAALGAAQMERIDELLEKRRKVAHWYTERLLSLPEIETPQIDPKTSTMSWFVYVIRFSPEIKRDNIASALKERGIPVRPYFVPIHLQPYMVKRFGYRKGDYPITEDLGERGLALPFSGVMTEEQVDYVFNNIKNVLRKQY